MKITHLMNEPFMASCAARSADTHGPSEPVYLTLTGL